MSLKLYIGCLPGNANESEVKDIFLKHGSVKTLQLLKEQNGGEKSSTLKCIGSGYLECPDQDSYESFLDAQIFYEGRKLEISPFLEKNQLEQMHQNLNLRKILVKYLPDETKNEDLENCFGLFGNLVNAFVSSDRKEKGQEFPSNYGIVVYEEQSSALLALNGKILIKGSPVIVRLHRFRKVKEGVFEVAGEELSWEDLLYLQIGYREKVDVSEIMGREYKMMAQEWDRRGEEWEQLVRFDRKKLKKECKRKKDKNLKKILFKIDKEERMTKENEEQRPNKKKGKKRKKKKKGQPHQGKREERKLDSREGKLDDLLVKETIKNKSKTTPFKTYQNKPGEAHPAYYQSPAPKYKPYPQNNSSGSGFKLVSSNKQRSGISVNNLTPKGTSPWDSKYRTVQGYFNEGSERFRGYVYSQGSNSMTDDDMWNWSKATNSALKLRSSNKKIPLSGVKLPQNRILTQSNKRTPNKAFQSMEKYAKHRVSHSPMDAKMRRIGQSGNFTMKKRRTQLNEIKEESETGYGINTNRRLYEGDVYKKEGNYGQEKSIFRNLTYETNKKKKTTQMLVEEEHMSSSESEQNQEELAIVQKKNVKFREEGNSSKNKSKIFSFNETKRNIFKQNSKWFPVMEKERSNSIKVDELIINENDEDSGKSKKKFRSVQLNNKTSLFTTKNLDSVSPMVSDNEDHNTEVDLDQEYFDFLLALQKQEEEKVEELREMRKHANRVYIELEENEGDVTMIELIRKLRLRVSINHYPANLQFAESELKAFRKNWSEEHNFDQKVECAKILN
jgi:hypothetical protein